jgi:hypothetical protein
MWAFEESLDYLGFEDRASEVDFYSHFPNEK